MTEPNILNYYAARAQEYEKVYAKPERQADLRTLHTVVPGYLRGRRVLEIACGTGYWTRRIVPSATCVIACDLVTEVLAVAMASQPLTASVTFCVGDAFQLDSVQGDNLDAGFAGFWWSHVLRQDIHRFLTGLHHRLPRGSRVLFVDNRYVAGSNWPVTRSDIAGNTYQHRQLDDGSNHEVLKNFPSPAEVVAAITAAGGREATCTELTYYWYSTHTVGDSDAAS